MEFTFLRARMANIPASVHTLRISAPVRGNQQHSQERLTKIAVVLTMGTML